MMNFVKKKQIIREKYSFKNIETSFKWMLFKAEEGIINPEEYLDFSKIK